MALHVLQQLAEQHAMIEQLASDSRRCAPGCVFFAYPGETADGRRYIADALARGASAVVWESEGFSWDARWQVPNTAVAGLKQQAGWIAHDFYGRPSEALWVCGVTGTNGKTSCTQWIAAALESLGVHSGVIGTLGSGFPGALNVAQNTTPDVLEVHALLAQMRQAGAHAVAMEASSHGLAQGRTNGVAFDCALFTNLSQDHLDYHGSMEAYGAAKALLFEAPSPGCGSPSARARAACARSATA
jgi:UDP-N-acetylmuramoyl-L-alanyl-D-glutamate--2,6-diaminopimelate ligase